MQYGNTKNNHGFHERVKKVKENYSIGIEKRLIQESFHLFLFLNNIFVFVHFHHPTRKKPIKQGQLRWQNRPSGSLQSSPGLQNEPHYVSVRLTMPGNHRVYFRTTEPVATSRQHRVTIWPAVEKGGQHNE